jgi:hypothetical protein
MLCCPRTGLRLGPMNELGGSPNEGISIPEGDGFQRGSITVPGLRRRPVPDESRSQPKGPVVDQTQYDNDRPAWHRLPIFYEPRQSGSVRPLGVDNLISRCCRNTVASADDLFEFDFFDDPFSLKPGNTRKSQRENGLRSGMTIEVAWYSVENYLPTLEPTEFDTTYCVVYCAVHVSLRTLLAAQPNIAELAGQWSADQAAMPKELKQKP